MEILALFIALPLLLIGGLFVALYFKKKREQAVANNVLSQRRNGQIPLQPMPQSPPTRRNGLTPMQAVPQFPPKQRRDELRSGVVGAVLGSALSSGDRYNGFQDTDDSFKGGEGGTFGGAGASGSWDSPSEDDTKSSQPDSDVTQSSNYEVDSIASGSYDPTSDDADSGGSSSSDSDSSSSSSSDDSSSSSSDSDS